LEALREKLAQDRSGKVPAFWLAIWLYRNRNWHDRTPARAVTDTLLREFNIDPEEQAALFELYSPERLHLFGEEEFNERSFLRNFPAAPDALPEEGGTLLDMTMEGVGPVAKLDFAPGRRLSVITGDNGLGKTFLLECAWWCLTGHWAERQALPAPRASDPKITFSIRSKNDVVVKQTVSFNLDRMRWPIASERKTLPGLVIYARVDGSFAIWDPARLGDDSEKSGSSGMLVFTRDEVLNGHQGKIEGLIRDWVRWQNNKDQTVFEMFEAVLKRLSPPDMEALKTGEATRLPGFTLDVPTLIHEYGSVPITNESAGVRRIVTVAYLLVWAWNEHKIHSAFLNKDPQSNVVIMIDEVEAHLHPKWQRTILPALLEVTKHLSSQVNPQMILTTHSPLVLASIETIFSEDYDRLFHLYLDNEKSVVLHSLDYIKRGTIDEWLTSDVFELKQARSREGEKAMEEAKQLLARSTSSVEEIRAVDELLRVTLPAEDLFWARWLHFIQAKGAL
jgi:hypothetical protein